MKNPAVYALVAALLAAIGVVLPDALWVHVDEAIAALVAIIGLFVAGKTRAT
ncbi:hypothetical protein AB4Y36_38105 [Paraburkholderia sp. BR10936]|uniref:hypothetical protein n=1 Tax=Paraburkholderia sp. BR10936 TaxID=3236993 RepID=UPI0034D1D650